MGLFGGKKFTISQRDWDTLQERYDAVLRDLENMKWRWRLVFPLEGLDLEEGALSEENVLAKIQEELGVEKLIKEARASLEAKVQDAAKAAEAEIARLTSTFPAYSEAACVDAEAQFEKMRAMCTAAAAEIAQIGDAFSTRIAQAQKDVREELEAARQEALGRIRQKIHDALQQSGDPQWDAMLKNVYADLDVPEIELRIAKELSPKVRHALDFQALTRAVASALIQEGEVDAARLQEQTVDALADILKEPVMKWVKTQTDRREIVAQAVRNLCEEGAFDLDHIQERIVADLEERLEPLLFEWLKQHLDSSAVLSRVADTLIAQGEIDMSQLAERITAAIIEESRISIQRRGGKRWQS